MAAKKKAAKRKAVPTPKQQIHLLATKMMADPRLMAYADGGGACEVAARALIALANERDRSVARAQHWCEVAIAREQRAELAEDALRELLESGLKARPSVPLVIAQAPQINGLPHPTFGEPGDGPTGRYSREART